MQDEWLVFHQEIPIRGGCGLLQVVYDTPQDSNLAISFSRELKAFCRLN